MIGICMDTGAYWRETRLEEGWGTRGSAVGQARGGYRAVYGWPGANSRLVSILAGFRGDSKANESAVFSQRLTDSAVYDK
jgi:hypothetical protein